MKFFKINIDVDLFAIRLVYLFDLKLQAHYK